MRVPRPWVPLLALLLIPQTPQTALADDHRADVFLAGFSAADGSLLLGPHVSVGKSFKDFLNGDVSVIFDFSVHFGADDDAGKRVLAAPGVRYSVATLTDKKLVHSGHVLLGSAWGKDNGGEGDADLGFAIGYEAEFIPTRTAEPYEGWAFRAQVDYVVRQGESDNYMRFSTGLVYRWKYD